MTSMVRTMSTLRRQVAQLAAASGKPEQLSTQEIKAAYDAGKITKAQKDVLARALSESSNRVTSIQAKLDEFTEAYVKTDRDGSGKVERTERDLAVAKYDVWRDLLSAHAPKAKLDAASKETVRVTRVGFSGSPELFPMGGLKTLIDKMNKLI